MQIKENAISMFPYSTSSSTSLLASLSKQCLQQAPSCILFKLTPF